LTQSKLNKPAEPSVTAVSEVQQDFDINSPIHSETLSKQQCEEFQGSRTNSSFPEPQKSFDITQRSDDTHPRENESELEQLDVIIPAKSDEIVTVETVSLPQKLAAPVMYDDETSTNSPESSDNSNDESDELVLHNEAKSFSTVDEFDEPRSSPVEPADSFDSLLDEPSSAARIASDTLIITTLSGRWGTVPEGAKKANGSWKTESASVTFLDKASNEEVRRVESFELRNHGSFVATFIPLV